MKRISAEAGSALWASGYDESPNPLLALEMRLLEPKLVELSPRSLLDVACGTGRWMAWAAARRVDVFGLDLSQHMLRQAQAKRVLRGRCTRGSIEALPFGADCADLAICSFALSYVPDPAAALREIGRVSRWALLSDMHPGAEAAGWTRSFRAAGETWEIEHFIHTEDALCGAARGAGFTRRWRIEGHFGEPEFPHFAAAGRAAAFESARQIPAVLATLWERC